MIWGPVLADPPMATLYEMRTVYSLTDALRMGDVLDYRAALQQAAADAAASEAKRG